MVNLQKVKKTTTTGFLIVIMWLISAALEFYTSIVTLNVN